MNTKIYLPKPCLEKWDKMTSIEKEKLCKICSRKVYDLTKMDTTEIVSLIDSGDRICGKIEKIVYLIDLNFPPPSPIFHIKKVAYERVNPRIS